MIACWMSQHVTGVTASVGTCAAAAYIPVYKVLSNTAIKVVYTFYNLAKTPGITARSSSEIRSTFKKLNLKG